jgi:hypothetical protein
VVGAATMIDRLVHHAEVGRVAANGVRYVGLMRTILLICSGSATHVYATSFEQIASAGDTVPLGFDKC